MDPEFKAILKDMQQDIKNLSEKVIEMTILYKQHESTSSNNSKRIDTLEQDTLMAKGSISTIKAIGTAVAGILLSSGISFCVWVVSTNFQLKQDISNASKEIAVLGMKVSSTKNAGETQSDPPSR